MSKTIIGKKIIVTPQIPRVFFFFFFFATVKICHDKIPLSCSRLCRGRAQGMSLRAQRSVAHAVPNRDKLATHVVSISCCDTNELRRDLGCSYHDLTLSRPKIFVSRPSFHSLHISLSRQGKVLSQHKVPCYLCPLSGHRRTFSQHRIFFYVCSLSRLKSLCRNRKIPCQNNLYRDTESHVATLNLLLPPFPIMHCKLCRDMESPYPTSLFVATTNALSRHRISFLG